MGLSTLVAEDALCGGEKSDTEAEFDADEYTDCGEYEYRACEVGTDVRFAERETLGLEVSDIVVVVADVDDLSIGVFNILLQQTECLVHVSQAPVKGESILTGIHIFPSCLASSWVKTNSFGEEMVSWLLEQWDPKEVLSLPE
jgi:hypothetical protein